MKVFNKQSRMWLIAAGLAMVVPAATTAQKTERSAERAADLLKSQQVQADLKAIENDRASAEHALLASWENVLDPNVYDLRDELGSIVSRTPAWQLYGASQVSDFKTMVDILRGKASAGQYINAPSGSGVSGDVADLFGDTTNQLVYTPISPCRVVDTRTAGGARTGFMPANTTRNFDLTTAAFTSGQGGSLACAGLPALSHFGWAINVTTTAQDGNGWLTLFPFSGAEPNASTLNFSVGQWSIANGVHQTGCYACGDDITVRAAQAGTHVIIDVVGYYTASTATASSVSLFAGTTTLVAAGARQYVFGGTCPAGTRLVSGEISHSGADLATGDFENSGGTSWQAWMINNDAFGSNVTVWARCLDAPVEVP